MLKKCEKLAFDLYETGIKSFTNFGLHNFKNQICYKVVNGKVEFLMNRFMGVCRRHHN